MCVVCIDMCIDTGEHKHTGMHTNMCIDVQADMWVDMHTGSCMDICMEMCVEVHMGGGGWLAEHGTIKEIGLPHHLGMCVCGGGGDATGKKGGWRPT